MCSVLPLVYLREFQLLMKETLRSAQKKTCFYATAST